MTNKDFRELLIDSVTAYFDVVSTINKAKFSSFNELADDLFNTSESNDSESLSLCLEFINSLNDQECESICSSGETDPAKITVFVQNKTEKGTPLNQVIFNKDFVVFKLFDIIKNRLSIANQEIETVNNEKAINRINELHDLSEIPNFSHTSPQKYTIPNAKVVNSLGQLIMDLGEPSKLQVSNHTSDEKEFVVVSVNYDEEGIELPHSFTRYDREVMNAVCSLFVAGNDYFTPDQVFRVMNGKKESEYIGTTSRNSVIKSLDRMRSMIVTLDLRAQRNLLKTTPPELEPESIEANLLYLLKANFKINGQPTSGYKILQKPILYSYSESMGQVINLDLKYLDTRGIIRSTPQVIAIRSYLLTRIATMKNEKTKLSNKILYNTLFDECNIKIPNDSVRRNKKRKQIRDQVSKLLDFWKEEGMIERYEETKRGVSYDGVLIYW